MFAQSDPINQQELYYKHAQCLNNQVLKDNGRPRVLGFVVFHERILFFGYNSTFEQVLIAFCNLFVKLKFFFGS